MRKSKKFDSNAAKTEESKNFDSYTTIKESKPITAL